MITLITGLPGNGKTLYAITWLKEKAEKDGRSVYYSGIKDCMVPGWIEGDPEKWMALPKGSIILIDEVQRLMRPRQHGTKVPDFVAALETHRHLGVDLVLITQHPMLLDSNVRRLVGQHFHMIRKFGTHMAVAHEWGATKENCDKNRDDSIQHQWRFPKSSFALYKSAEVHTHKARIPKKVWLLLALPFVIGGIAYYVWFYRLSPDVKRGPLKNAFTGEVVGTGGPGGSPKLSKTAYISQFVARVPGLAYTAPVYDEVTKPVEAPFPAACAASSSHDPSRAGEYGHSLSPCQCYTQQGTRLEVPPDLCLSIARGGFFVAWQQKAPVVVPAVPLQHPTSTPDAPLSRLAGFGASPRQEGPSASVLPSTPTEALPPGRGRALPPIPSSRQTP